MINTVLGQVNENEINAVLSHEHICCYSEYLRMMAGNNFFDEEELLRVSVKQLTSLKDKYGVNLFVDCTPVNIGRNIELLKRVSAASGVHIVCSTGFYYTEEIILCDMPVESLTEYYVNDARSINAGIIKAAVEAETLTELNKKFLVVCANTHKSTGLPIVLHSNAGNMNGLKALEILLDEGVPASAITVGHLSDTRDIEYVKSVAQYGCYIGLDRLYESVKEDYVDRKLHTINSLVDAGYVDKILLSHDDIVYNGFSFPCIINYNTRFNYVFDSILTRLPNDIVETIIKRNPVRMLNCQ